MYVLPYLQTLVSSTFKKLPLTKTFFLTTFVFKSISIAFNKKEDGSRRFYTSKPDPVKKMSGPATLVLTHTCHGKDFDQTKEVQGLRAGHINGKIELR